VSDGTYWDGSAFASATEVFVPASGTTTWSLAFAGASFPAAGSYALSVRARDNVGNLATAATATFVYDATSPAEPSGFSSTRHRSSPGRRRQPPPYGSTRRRTAPAPRPRAGRRPRSRRPA
jgi:hypothetical protein